LPSYAVVVRLGGGESSLRRDLAVAARKRCQICTNRRRTQVSQVQILSPRPKKSIGYDSFACRAERSA